MKTKKTYSEKLKDPRWQKKRLEVLDKNNFTCQECGNKKEELSVLSVNSMMDIEPWDYDATLWCLCKDCHKERHEIQERVSMIIGNFNTDALYTLDSILETITEKELLFLQTVLSKAREIHTTE